MPPSLNQLPGTLVPFLYPFLLRTTVRATATPCLRQIALKVPPPCRAQSTQTEHIDTEDAIDRLNPPPTDYSRTIFADRAEVKVLAGSGGHGCVAFLREKFIEAGPANGGDGGTGGNVFIQAVEGETSLHKLARSGILKAGRGGNGQGKGKGGERGEDIVIQVPVGTVVRELGRYDPVDEQQQRWWEARQAAKERKKMGIDEAEEAGLSWVQEKANREKFILYPAITDQDVRATSFPKLGRARRSQLHMLQPKEGIFLDLSSPTERPILLAAGAVGGLGNPHFISKDQPRPKFATKGEEGMELTLSLELKLLADVGLVGLPNAGKSTLLRAMSNSRARVGNWAFTTLQPNIGTVVIDDHLSRPVSTSRKADGRLRVNFTIADIPGLIEDAHLDKGLGISFLRHVERARVLAFVVDLNAGDAATALKALWREVGMYERMKVEQDMDDEAAALAQEETPATVVLGGGAMSSISDDTTPSSIATKPWMVIGTKADLPSTQENFMKLQQYLKDVKSGKEPHPSGYENGWKDALEALPISAIRGHGMERVREWTLSVLDA